MGRAMESLKTVGIVGSSRDLSSPGDRRRVGCWARSRQVSLEVRTPEKERVVVVGPLSDARFWSQWRRRSSERRLLVDVVDFGYLSAALTPGYGLATGLTDMGRVALYARGMRRLPLPGFGARFRKLLEVADVIVCASPEQAAFVSSRGLNASSVADCHEEIPLVAPRETEPTGGLVLFWQGQPATLPFLAALASPLAKVSAHRPIELLVCTRLRDFRYAGRFMPIEAQNLLEPLGHVPGLTVRFADWNVDNLSSAADRAHVGLLPVVTTERNSLMKAENRALEMWRLGLPLLMSNTPAYARVAQAASVDGIATDLEEWSLLLERASNPEWRYVQARRGYNYVRSHHSPELVHALWDDIFANNAIAR